MGGWVPARPIILLPPATRILFPFPKEESSNELGKPNPSESNNATCAVLIAVGNVAPSSSVMFSGSLAVR